jgi:hypothetical protein
MVACGFAAAVKRCSQPLVVAGLLRRRARAKTPPTLDVSGLSPACRRPLNAEIDHAGAFWHFRYTAYTGTEPHKGYKLLGSWAKEKKMGGFSFTSNIVGGRFTALPHPQHDIACRRACLLRQDGHWEASGFPAERIEECHGSLRFMQVRALTLCAVRANAQRMMGIPCLAVRQAQKRQVRGGDLADQIAGPKNRRGVLCGPDHVPLRQQPVPLCLILIQESSCAEDPLPKCVHCELATVSRLSLLTGGWLLRRRDRKAERLDVRRLGTQSRPVYPLCFLHLHLPWLLSLFLCQVPGAEQEVP